MLSPTQIAQFVEQGYCVGSTEIDPVLARKAIDITWDLAPAHFRRDDPSSWQGAFTDSCHGGSVEDRRGRVKWRECLRKERWLYDLIVENRFIREGIRALLGEPLRPDSIRGLYPVYPSDRRGRVKVRGHVDRHPFQVGTVLYLSEVADGAGGFTVWPGSHRILADFYATRGGDQRQPGHERALQRIHRKIQPVEISGVAGTVVFWHHRLTHTAGINRRETVRQAILGDFKNRSFSDHAGEAAADLWEDWSCGPGREGRDPEPGRPQEGPIPAP